VIKDIARFLEMSTTAAASTSQPQGQINTTNSFLVMATFLYQQTGHMEQDAQPTTTVNSFLFEPNIVSLSLQEEF